MKLAEPSAIRWTRREYYELAERGFFNGRRVELVRGEIFVMAPQNSPHTTGVSLTADVLRTILPTGYVVRSQMPLFLRQNSEPEPDVAVVAGAIRDYVDEHPTTALLAVEVAESSLRYDRTTKLSLYAEGGIEEYWILNLVDRQLEVYRSPDSGPAYPNGFGYSDKRILGVGDSISPLALPGAIMQVADLLP